MTATTKGGEARARHQQAQIRHPALDQLQPGIAAVEQGELDLPADCRMLGRRQAQMQLEADVAGGGAGTTVAIELRSA